VSLDFTEVDRITKETIDKWISDLVLHHAATVETALQAQQDGLIYEDDYVTVERRDGQVYMTGKPFKSVLIYDKPEEM
jgi:hypothetical protein